MIQFAGGNHLIEFSTFLFCASNNIKNSKKEKKHHQKRNRSTKRKAYSTYKIRKCWHLSIFVEILCFDCFGFIAFQDSKKISEVSIISFPPSFHSYQIAAIECHKIVTYYE